MKKINPLNNRLLLKKYQFPKPESKIILPNEDTNKQNFYEVVSCGNHVFLDEGDIVIIEPYKNITVNLDDETYFLVKEEDIVAYISDLQDEDEENDEEI